MYIITELGCNTSTRDVVGRVALDQLSAAGEVSATAHHEPVIGIDLELVVTKKQSLSAGRGMRLF